MSSPPPSGHDPNHPAPPQQPGVPTAQPDRGAGLALAGFLCGLISFIVVMAAFLSYYIAARYVTSAALRFLTLYVSLILAAFPVALAGLILSFRGRHSRARRRLAIVGMALSLLAMVPFVYQVVAIILGAVYCSSHQCF